MTDRQANRGLTLPPAGPKEKEAAAVQKAAADAVFEHMTDTGNAKRMAVLHQGRILYCPTHRAWYIWDGQIWARDQTLQIDLLAKETVLVMLREAVDGARDEDERRKRVAWCMSSENTAKLRAMVENARSELAITPQELNADPYLLSVENGTIELKTGKLRPHDPDDLITLPAPVRYRADAADDRWEDVLNRFVRPDEGKESFLQRAAFASLTGSTSDKVFINLYDANDGNTGKTTFLTSLQSMLGPYAGMVNAETFLVRSNGTGGIRSDLASVDGVRMVVSSETPTGRKLDTALMKKLTGGGGTFKFERKYENDWEATVTFTIWLDGNSVAKANAEDHPLFNRWRLTPFMHQIEGKPDPRWIEEACAAPEYRAAVLAWAMRGRADWLVGGIGTAPSVEAASKEVRAEMDPLRDFWVERCEFGEHTKTDRFTCLPADLYEAYTNWVNIRGSGRPINEEDFKRLTRGKLASPFTITVSISGNKRSAWRGVRLRPEKFRSQR